MPEISKNRKFGFFLVFSLAIFGLTVPYQVAAFAVETNNGTTLIVTG